MIGLGADYVISVNGHDVSMPTEVIGDVRPGRLHPARGAAKGSPVSIKVGEHRLVTERTENGKMSATIYFAKDSSVPLDTGVLGEFDGREVDITGHASPEGGDAYNMELSRKRALGIADIAKKAGVRVRSVRWVGSRECSAGVRDYPYCRKTVLTETE